MGQCLLDVHVKVDCTHSLLFSLLVSVGDLYILNFPLSESTLCFWLLSITLVSISCCYQVVLKFTSVWFFHTCNQCVPGYYLWV